MSDVSLKSLWSHGWLQSFDGATHFSSIIVHFLIAFMLLVIIVCVSTLLNNTRVTPTPPKGYLDYNALQMNRRPFADMIITTNAQTNNPAPKMYPDSTPMSLFQVATANFGGIFTETNSWLNPWLGSVSTDAVTLQVEAGARAVIFDVWPDPANPGSPIVASMVDVQQWYYQRQWASAGNMDKGVGRYSNWNLLTRNTAPLSDMLLAANNAAFGTQGGSVSNQNSDPFFVILNLHGAMTAAYLNLIGTTINSAFKGHQMGSEWTLSANNTTLFQTATVSQFKSQAFVIAVPDIQPGYYSLPGINTLDGFINTILPTASTLSPYQQFLDNVNLIQTTLSPKIMFSPDENSTVSQLMQSSSTQKPLAIIQPSIGAQVTDNDPLFGLSSVAYSDCLNTKAQFVGINLFTSNSNDSAMTTYMDTANFGTYSFKYIGS